MKPQVKEVEIIREKIQQQMLPKNSKQQIWMNFGIPVVISNPARPRFKTGKIDFAVNKDYISFD